ncbi:MAG: PadR family transcriptional regulator [Methanobacterium paludis]|nr:PadR family transcriptional regulator [Methanobacterium paludis]
MVNIFERFETEMKRGVIQVAVMCLLENERYGYNITKSLKSAGLKVEEGTLYPLLRRLENDKLLSSRWDTNDSRPRKYYMITEYGKQVRTSWLDSLKSINTAIEQFENGINKGDN